MTDGDHRDEIVRLERGVYGATIDMVEKVSSDWIKNNKPGSDK
jgi:hypothetical protein